MIALIPFVFISAQGDFNFNVDYTSFKYDSSSNYIELYYSFPSFQLKVVNKDNKFQVEGLLHIELKNDSTSVYLVNKEWKIPYYVKDTSVVSRSNSLIGVLKFIVPAGKYTCSVEGSDFNDTTLKKLYKFYMTEKPYGTKSMTVSDVQLASKIKQAGADTNSIFYKNTLEVTPIPSGIFGANAPVLFYYAELYNLDKVPDISTVKFESSVYDKKGAKIYSRTITSLKPLSASVQAGVINVSKYISGKYYLVLSLSDSSTGRSILSNKQFYVYNPSVIDTTAKDVSADTSKTLNNQFAYLSGEECDDIFAKSEYIASKDEKEQYDKISTVEGKRGFLEKFWTQKANVSNGDKRYSYIDYMKRVKIADEKFKNIAKKGWQSDMGRVYIIYGEPSEIERHPNENDSKPYEIWKYDQIEGGVQFIFGDLSGFKNYVLLSSTKQGEVENDNWQSLLRSVR